MLSIFNQRQLRRKLGNLIPNNKARLYSTIATLLIVGIVAFILGTTALFAWYSKDLPRPDKVRRVEGFSTIIYDRNGEVLYDVYADQNRIPAEFKDLPLNLRNATIAIEDKSFYQHQGFDPVGYLRAIRQIIFYRNLAGGSTLTQQLVKNVLLTSERTLPRKIKEFILAVQIEKKYTKDEILQMYLNEAPYGGTAWGVEAGSKTYFNKHTKDLNLIESAVLAGLPQSPSLYNPFNSNAYIARTSDVLRRMREDKYISKEQEQQALKDLANLKFAPQGINTIKAPHFVMYVREQLMNQFGEKMVEGGGLRVTTSLDYKVQEEAEKIVAEEAAKLAPFKASNAAAVVLNPQTGEILAMVGSKDYFNTEIDGNVNVVLAQRQPGSAGKPIVYATAFKQGYTPASLLMDVKTDFPSGNPTSPIYTPVNYDGKFRGPVQIRFTLGNSLNIPAVKMVALVGVKNVMQQGFDMGISTWQPTEENMKNVGLSLALGGREVKMLDLASAYGVFAQGGVRHDPVSILKVQTSDGKKLYEYKQTSGRKVLGDDIAYLISHILLDNNARSAAFGTNSYLVIPGKTVAVKSGTTDQKRDNWTFGYTPSLVVGTWVGNNDNSPMNPTITSGVTGASPIWNKIMRFLLKDRKNEEFKKPDNVNALEVDSLSGGPPVEGQPKRTEYFIKGTEPQTSSVYQKLKISKNDPTKLANPVEIAAGDYQEKDFLVFKENDPVSTDGKNLWQEGINAWIASLPDNDKYKYPTETSSGAADRVVVKIKNPSDHTQYNENDLQVEASAVAQREVVKMEVFANGNSKASSAGNSISQKIHLDDGPYEIKFKGTDSAGNSSEVSVRIGVKVPWDQATPTPSPSPTPTLTPTPTPTP